MLTLIALASGWLLAPLPAPRGAARAARMSATPVFPGLIDPETISRVKSELWRASDADPALLEKEQRETTAMLVATIAETARRGEAELNSATEPLNELVAPHLPLLLGRNFPAVAREVLATVRTVEERGALLQLSQFIVGVQQEVADALSALQWRQQEKLRELCDAAADGGTPRLMEMAEAMRAELDTDFCNYLNYAIEQAEAELTGAGVTPYLPPYLAASAPAAALPAPGGAAQWSASADRDANLQWSASADRDANLSPLHPDSEGRPAGAAAAPAAPGSATSAGGTPERQQWLLVLRCVRQGVYAMLAVEYDSDVKQIRYIFGLTSVDARQELTHRTLLEMSEEQQAHFRTTLGRIVDNLSVQRNARDLQLFKQAVEVQAFADEYGKDYSGVGQFGE